MSKTVNKLPMKLENKGPGDHRRESSGGRNDRGDKSHSHSHSRSDSGSRSKHLGRDSNSKPVDPANQTAAEDGDKNESKGAEEKKFTGRCRLFVGNLTPDVTEDVFKKMFLTYGEVSEVYVNSSRGFGFIRLDYRQNAEAAKAGLDGTQRKGRVLRVRFATHGAALRVKNLHPYVSNELLEQAFTQFGELERAIVIVDDRGKPTGEGLVEFVRKPGAQQALRRVKEGVFLFGADPKPIEVEPLEQKDDEDGMPEKFVPKNEQYKKEREKDPHFAPHGSFEYEFGMRWKQLAEMEKKRIENVKREMEEARIKLEDEMQNALYDYQAEQIRQDLLRQQEELRRIEELRNQDRMRRQKELEMRAMTRHAEEERERQQEERRRQEMMMRQQEMQRRSGGGPRDSGMARGREELMSMRGEGAGSFQGNSSAMGMRSGQNQSDPQMRGGRGGAPPMQPPPAPPAGMGLERGQPGMGSERGGPHGMGMERGQQGMTGMDRGQQNLAMERGGPQGMGMDRPQQSMAMERGGQQNMSRQMQQNSGNQAGQGNFGGQSGLSNSNAGNPSGSRSPNINNLSNVAAQGTPGNQLELDTATLDEDCDLQGTTSADPSQPVTSVVFPTQNEDGDDEDGPPLEHTHLDLEHGHSELQRNSDSSPATDDLDSALFSECNSEFGYGEWIMDKHSIWPSTGSNPSKVDTDTVCDSKNWFTDAVYLGKSSESLVADAGNICDSQLRLPEMVDSPSDSEHVDSYEDCLEAETAFAEQSLEQVILEDEGHSQFEGLSISDEEPVASEDNLPSSQALAAANMSVTDEPVTLERDTSASGSYSTSVCTSPSSSPLPPTHVRPGASLATAATGVPLHQATTGVGQTCYVRVHPMHVAAAVAAQRSQAAAVAQHQAHVAAAIHQQRTAVAARQQAAAVAAAAQQQRTRAALMHQQVVRNRYLGAPVLVQRPFAPVPGVATPVRVRMRLRRSVLMTEEYSLNHP